MTGTRNDRHDIDKALRTLDAADPYVDPRRPRARADLARILATDPHAHAGAPSAGPAGRTPRARWSLRRVALAGGALAAVTTGLVALPSLTGGDQALASWTSVPDQMTPEQRADAAISCRQAEMEGAGTDYIDELSSAEPVIAERRGVWNTVVLAGTAGFAALCITDDSAGLFTMGMIGSIGSPDDAVLPGPRELAATDLGTGTMSAGDLSLAAGTVGTEIVGVVYRSRSHGDVTATVSAGRFAFWFPGDELEDVGSTDGVQVEVTYRDGGAGTAVLKL